MEYFQKKKRTGSSRTGWCKNYCGMHDKKSCDAGVEYDSVRVDGEWKYREFNSSTIYTKTRAYPCFLDDVEMAGCRCESQEFMSPDEIRDYERQFADRIEKLNASRMAILSHTNGSKGVSGQIPCPCCDVGILRFTIASCNGHIHAGCTTEGCVRWME